MKLRTFKADKPLRVFAVVILSFLSFLSRPAAASKCAAFDRRIEILPLRSWHDLRPVTESPLTVELANTIDLHSLTRKLRERFHLGRELAFQLEEKADFGGWQIQGDFLMKVIAHILPQAQIVEQGEKMAHGFSIELIDSTQGNRFNSGKFDMSDLKILNSGPLLPDKRTLRALLNLPASARIISAYESSKASFDPKELVRGLFDNDLVDIVLLSAQSEARRYDRWSWHPEVPLISSQRWNSLPPNERPKKVIIFNETRHRLPYMHAVADAVIVMGKANFFEPIYTGRPTYIDQFSLKGSNTGGWERLVTAAQRTGLGYPFASPQTLVSLLALGERYEFGKSDLFVNQAGALDTVMRTIDNITSPNPVRQWSQPLFARPEPTGIGF